jgi:hypothetical protein
MEATRPLIQPLGSDETWTDENGTLWSRPTAWAYAQACKALHKHQDEFLAGLAGIKVDRERVLHLSTRMVRASGKLMMAAAGGTNAQSAQSFLQEARDILDQEVAQLPLLDEKEMNLLRLKLKKKEDANEKLGKQLQEALAECKRLSELRVELEHRLAEKRGEEAELQELQAEKRKEEKETPFPLMSDHLERWAQGANIALLERLIRQADKNVHGHVIYRAQLEKHLQREKRGRGLQAHDALERRLFIDQLKSYLTEHGRSELKDLLRKIEEEERGEDNA